MADTTLAQAYHRLLGGERNLSPTEAGLSIVLGLGLAAAGVRKADGRGLLMGLGGTLLVARGMSRHCPVKSYLEHHPRGSYRPERSTAPSAATPAYGAAHPHATDPHATDPHAVDMPTTDMPTTDMPVPSRTF